MLVSDSKIKTALEAGKQINWGTQEGKLSDMAIIDYRYKGDQTKQRRQEEGMNCQTKIRPIDKVRKINSIGLLPSIKCFMVSSFGNKKSWMLDKT